jgi:hypothetical protein
MKNYLFSKVILLFTFLCIFNFAQSQKAVTPFNLQVGNKLIYNVEQGLNEYKFIMTIKTLKPMISFDWKMTAPVNKKGTVVISKKAMDSAVALFNYFENGSIKLEEQTCAFLSRNLSKQLQEGKDKIEFSVTENKGDAEVFDVLKTNKSEVSGNIYFPVTKKYKGKNYSLDSYTLENKDGSNKLRIWKNQNFPLIIFMETNFKIYLSEIQ